jgi:hypothetical protein
MPASASVRVARASGRVARASAAALLVAGVALAPEAVAAATSHGGGLAKAKFVNASLVAVSVVPGSSTAWALGTRSTSRAPEPFYALRGSGHKWTQVAIKGPKGFALQNGSQTIAAGSAKSVWLVGSVERGSTQEPLIEHSTGGAFKALPAKIGAGSLVAVDASSASNAYAVGSSTDGTPLIAHWNGKTWTVVSTTGQASGTSYDAVSTSGPNNAWFLGAFGTTTEIASWNGHHFTLTGLPLPAGASLESIASGSPKDTWVVGYRAVKKGAMTRTESFTEHFNGVKWVKLAAPSPYFDSYPASVSVAGSRVYLAGQGTRKSGQIPAALVMRYVGGHWHAQHVAKSGKSSLFTSISVSSKGAVAAGSWFAGTINGSGATPSNGLSERLRGRSWHKVAMPKLRR